MDNGAAAPSASSAMLPDSCEQHCETDSPRELTSHRLLSARTREVQFSERCTPPGESSSKRCRSHEPVATEEDVLPEHVQHSRLVKSVSVVGLTLTIATCGALGLNLALHSGLSAASHRDYVAGSHPDFVNYVAGKVHPTLGRRPGLCDVDIVKMTCTVLNNETVEAYGSAIDSDPRYVHAIELSETLSISKSSVIGMLKSLQLTNWAASSSADAFAVNCQELCEKLVASFPPRVVPSMSDVGCYWPPNALATILNQAPICDVDVSPSAMANITFKDILPTKEDERYGEFRWMDRINPDSAGTNNIDAALNDAADPSPAEQQVLRSVDYPNMSTDQLRMNTIHLFRIFPAINSQVQDGAGFMGMFAPAEPQRPTVAPTAAPARRLRHDENVTGTFNSKQGGFQETGDRSFVERMLTATPDDSCAYARDGNCDYDTGNCAPGTDCTDCRGCNPNGQTDDSCTYSRDGTCDEPPQSPFYCYAGTDCTDCGTCPGPAHNLGGIRTRYTSGEIPHWKQKTLQLAVKAKAVCNQAVTAMASRQIPSVVTTWFGNNWDLPTRQEIKRVINGVKGMLDNVDYIYPGDQCQPYVYAYVYPNDPYNKNAAGKYLFHLCDYYMKVNEEEQIETLLHEGSHHMTMRTDDSTWNGQTMYGRPVCKQVARLCQQGNLEACAKARKNADSYCYFINDAAKSAGIVQPAGRRRYAPPPTPPPTPAPTPAPSRAHPVVAWLSNLFR